MTMTFQIIPDEDALGNCAWCNGRIYEDTEVFALGAKLRPGVDLSEYQSHCIEIELASEGKNVNMMVTAEGSEAKMEGKDAMFLLCSEKCGKKLKGVLQKEITIGDLFDSFQP